MDDQDSSDTPNKLLKFPQSRVQPPSRSAKELGFGKRAKALGIPKAQLYGHWCSACHGIWYGYMLEVECPQCGKRDG
ncbi:MAG: hypothetical protein AAGF92_15675 [Myxococcota bacterium]